MTVQPQFVPRKYDIFAGLDVDKKSMLGYEPSAVRSHLFLADYSRCAFDLGMEPKKFLTDFNPVPGFGDTRRANPPSC
jgi:hypothetical protein